MGYTRYGAFSKKNGVYLASQVSENELTAQDMGFSDEEAYIAIIKEGEDFSSCKYDFDKQCIVKIDHKECNTLLSSVHQTSEELLESNYYAAQILYIEHNDCDFGIHLYGNEYKVFKEKIQSAVLYGNAEFLCHDYYSCSNKILTGLTTEQWIEIGKKADEISTKNYIHYQTQKERLLTGETDVDFNFPTPETIIINKSQ